jgi:hypothetical protein
MSAVTVRALRAGPVVPPLAGSAMVASAGHASATTSPNGPDQPKISADDRQGHGKVVN